MEYVVIVDIKQREGDDCIMPKKSLSANLKALQHVY